MEKIKKKLHRTKIFVAQFYDQNTALHRKIGIKSSGQKKMDLLYSVIFTTRKEDIRKSARPTDSCFSKTTCFRKCLSVKMIADIPAVPTYHFERMLDDIPTDSIYHFGENGHFVYRKFTHCMFEPTVPLTNEVNNKRE